MPPVFTEVSYQGNILNRSGDTADDINYRMILLGDKLDRSDYLKFKAMEVWSTVLEFGWDSYKSFVTFVKKYDKQIWSSLLVLTSLALFRRNHQFVLEQMERAKEINHTLNPITLQLTPNASVGPNLQSEEAIGHSLNAIKSKGTRGKTIKDIVSLQTIDIPDRRVYIKTPHSIFTGFMIDSTTILLTRHEALAIDSISYLHINGTQVKLNHAFQLKIVDDLQSALLILSVKDQLSGVRSCISSIYATEQALTSDLLRYDVYSVKHRQLTPYYIAQGLSLTEDEYLS